MAYLLSLSFFLLFLGLTQAHPLQLDEKDEMVFTEDPDDLVDITTRILQTNNGTTETLMEGDVMVPRTRTAIRCLWSNECLWERKKSENLVKVPYTLSSDFDSYSQGKIKYAMNTFHTKTCVRFVQRSNQRDYLSIESRSGCSSWVGKTGGKQLVSLEKRGCVYHGTIQHELLHALGFYHEQNRSDRDKYIRINWEYVERGEEPNFDKEDTDNLDIPYDYSSVMHYNRWSFSTVYRKETITPIPDATVSIGQSLEMSAIDVQRVNKLYRC
ncbi:hatching enzyme 1.2-like [Salvelinus fontinalis]|uniref:hatching enzyme 1.2-like n=1 Tax=Salvelinus fontinalis TaxID=8038 RepID=UPI0024864AB0|nr:hatching enzyme 1.2-like [Salvelinus fontinalis]